MMSKEELKANIEAIDKEKDLAIKNIKKQYNNKIREVILDYVRQNVKLGDRFYEDLRQGYYLEYQFRCITPSYNFSMWYHDGVTSPKIVQITPEKFYRLLGGK